MKIIESEFSEENHGHLWRLSSALKGYASPVLAKKGVKIFQPLEVTFFLFPTLFSDGVLRYFVQEEDIPLILSFLKLRDKGIRRPVLKNLVLPWPEFIYIQEEACKLGVTPEQFLKQIISTSMGKKRLKGGGDENHTNSEIPPESV